MAKATDFNCGWYIHRVNPNKSPLKFWRKESVGIPRDCPKVFKYLLSSQEWVKLQTSNFVPTFIR